MVRVRPRLIRLELVPGNSTWKLDSMNFEPRLTRDTPCPPDVVNATRVYNCQCSMICTVSGKKMTDFISGVTLTNSSIVVFFASKITKV